MYLLFRTVQIITVGERFWVLDYSEWKIQSQRRVVDSAPNTHGTQFEALDHGQRLPQLLDLLMVRQASYGRIERST